MLAGESKPDLGLCLVFLGSDGLLASVHDMPALFEHGEFCKGNFLVILEDETHFANKGNDAENKRFSLRSKRLCSTRGSTLVSFTFDSVENGITNGSLRKSLAFIFRFKISLIGPSPWPFCLLGVGGRLDDV